MYESFLCCRRAVATPHMHVAIWSAKALTVES
jgi:hypothetical protein